MTPISGSSITAAKRSCSYRASFTEGGKTLILFAADNTQDQSYCPSGELKAAGR